MILSPNVSTGWFLGKTVFLQHLHMFRILNTGFCGESFYNPPFSKRFTASNRSIASREVSSSRDALAPHHTFLLPFPILLFSAKHKKKLNFVSPEPLVSCAQAPPAKGHDGLWGRECVFLGLCKVPVPSLVWDGPALLIDHLSGLYITQSAIRFVHKVPIRLLYHFVWNPWKRSLIMFVYHLI